MSNFSGSSRSQVSLLQALQAVAQDEPRGSNLQTPSGNWQTIRRHGSADELATKARSYIQGLLVQGRQSGY